MTWSVQLAPNVSKDVADTDDERVVERWEPGEIISGDDEDEDEDDDVAKGEGRREDFLGRRTRSSIRRRKRLRRRERRPSAEVCRNIQGDTSVTSPRVHGSVAVNLASSLACGPLLQLATAQSGEGNCPN